MTDKRPQRSNESFFKTVNIRGIYSSLEEAHEFCCSSFTDERELTKIDQEKHKIEPICIWNPMTTGLSCVQPPPPLKKKLGRSLSLSPIFSEGRGRLYTGYYRIYYINLRHQYGVSVAETQTFLLYKSKINKANCIAKKFLLIKQTENLISLSYFTRNADSMIKDFFPSFLFEMTAIRF